MDKYKFGEFIYQKRKELGLTQDELGYKLGITNKAVSKWETGDNLPDIMMLKKLAQVFGLTVDELLSQKEMKKEKLKNTKVNKFLLVSTISLCVLEIITIIFCILFVSSKLNKENIQNIDKYNLEEIVNITPINNFICEGQNLTINSLYKLDNKFYLKEESIKFTINYKINFYYYLVDDSIGIVTYYNRNVDIELNSESNSFNNTLLLEPITEIKNFKSIKNVEVTYEIISANGVVYY